MLDLHHQHPDLLNPPEDIRIQPAILLSVLGIIEPLAAKFLLDFVKP